LSAAVFGAVGAFFLPAGAALADPMADAKDLFTRGRELRLQGDCSSAVAMFSKAYELYPLALGSLRNLAECDEALGRYASARRAWVDLKRALLTNGDRKYDGWAQDAEQAAARLGPQLATLTVDVNVQSPAGEALPAERVDVTLDGERLAPAQIGTPLERDPGRHVVRVTGEHAGQPQERVVDLSSGNVKRVSVRVVVGDAGATTSEGALPSRAAFVPADRPPAGIDAQESARATRRTWGWVITGVGAGALAGAGVSFAVRQAALDDLDRQCPGHQQCDPALASTVSRGQTASTLTMVLGAVGAVGLAGGIVLLVTSGGHGRGSASIVIAPGIGGLSAAGSF
jgi:hypothetical protein